MKNKTRGNIHKKEWLLRYTELKEEVDRELEQARFWRERSLSLSTPNMDNMGIRSANVLSAPDCVDKFMEISDSCSENAERANNAKNEITEAIDKLENVDERRLLKMHYINGYSLVRASCELDCTLDWTYRLHRNALKKIEIF